MKVNPIMFSYRDVDILTLFSNITLTPGNVGFYSFSYEDIHF